MNVLKDNDVRRDVLNDRQIAIIGFGSQGHAHALNLRDSGQRVSVGARPGGASWTAAQQAGFTVRDVPTAVRKADVVMILIPDEDQPAVYARDIGPHLKRGAYLGFAHGFAIHYRKIIAPPHTNVFLAAPNGVGQLVRRQFEAGNGVPCVIAVQQDPVGNTRDIAAAYACGIGGGRAGILETTFREETETDLFAEQAVLCGGLTALIRAGFETLVDAGYTPEMAYFCCLHEVKLLADLVHERGIAGMRDAISNTAKYGDLTRGQRVIGQASREAMRELLNEIQSGRFADEWMNEVQSGKPELARLIAENRNHPIEQVGSRLRATMPWLGQSEHEASSAPATASGGGSGFIPAPGQPGTTPGAAPAPDRGTAAPGHQDPCCVHHPGPVAGTGWHRSEEPVDVSGHEWPGFEAPPCWFVRKQNACGDDGR